MCQVLVSIASLRGQCQVIPSNTSSSETTKFHKDAERGLGGGGGGGKMGKNSLGEVLTQIEVCMN